MNMILNGWSRPWHLTLYLILLLNSCARCRPAFTDGQRTTAEITCSKTSFSFNGTASHVKKLGISSFLSRENEIPQRTRTCKDPQMSFTVQIPTEFAPKIQVFFMLKCRNCLLSAYFTVCTFLTIHLFNGTCYRLMHSIQTGIKIGQSCDKLFLM